MDLLDRLRAIANRIPQQAEHLQTEEATKMALIVPFLAALGWDVYNPFEVVPEFTADVGTKKGEKVDYAIMRDKQAIILLEAKKVGVNLDNSPASQLYRYFAVSKARVGILTDGIHYRFFSDLDEPNKMDARPFLEFDMSNFDDSAVFQLKQFTKEGFNVENMISAAVELKYTRAIKSYISQQAQNPDEDLVRFFVGKVYSGRTTQSVKEQFTDIVRRALAGWLNDGVARRLKTALSGRLETEETVRDEGLSNDATTLPDGIVAIDGDIITTQEEVDGYLIVKAIVAGTLPASRVAMRDGKSYCAVLIDNNNRRPLCRLRFNSKTKKYLGIFDEEKNETKFELSSMESLYDHADALRTSAARYAEPA